MSLGLSPTRPGANEHHEDCCTLLDTIVGERPVLVIQPLALEDQLSLVQRDALLVADLGRGVQNLDNVASIDRELMVKVLLLGDFTTADLEDLDLRCGLWGTRVTVVEGTNADRVDLVVAIRDHFRPNKDHKNNHHVK